MQSTMIKLNLVTEMLIWLIIAFGYYTTLLKLLMLLIYKILGYFNIFFLYTVDVFEHFTLKPVM